MKNFFRESEESKLKINVNHYPNTAVYRIVFCCLKTITYICYFYTINFMHLLLLMSTIEHFSDFLGEEAS